MVADGQSTIVEIIEAYQPSESHWYSRNLQQQKLQKHTSQAFLYGCRRTIYNSRNYRSILADNGLQLTLPNLQQQKLQKHTSQRLMKLMLTLIYNSRNYRSILARSLSIVGVGDLQQQKLQKHTSHRYSQHSCINLQQQKLQKHTSLLVKTDVTIPIYNSRNYRSILASIKINALTRSTIVEIIEAYQPLVTFCSVIGIYNSRNYRSILAVTIGTKKANHLQQQKLQKHTSLEAQTPHLSSIYNSRNYRSILASYRLQRYKKSFK